MGSGGARCHRGALHRVFQGDIQGVVTDVSSADSVNALAEQVYAMHGACHLLFNNAGVVQGGSAGPVWETPDQDWQWIMGVNFGGVLNGVQVFAPHMIAHGEEGHIVNTASIAAFIPGSGPYGISKHGVVILSEGLAFDLMAAKTTRTQKEDMEGPLTILR